MQCRRSLFGDTAQVSSSTEREPRSPHSPTSIKGRKAQPHYLARIKTHMALCPKAARPALTESQDRGQRVAEGRVDQSCSIGTELGGHPVGLPQVTAGFPASACCQSPGVASAGSPSPGAGCLSPLGSAAGSGHCLAAAAHSSQTAPSPGVLDGWTRARCPHLGPEADLQCIREGVANVLTEDREGSPAHWMLRRIWVFPWPTCNLDVCTGIRALKGTRACVEEMIQRRRSMQAERKTNVKKEQDSW